jgi:hypothetical protein
MKWDAAAASVLVVIILGQQLYDLWFHPEWTQAEQFWARWPFFATIVLGVLLAEAVSQWKKRRMD